MLKSVDDIVDALGGNAAVAALVGVGESAICNWKKRRVIPPSNFIALSAELSDRGKRFDPSVFGFKSAEAAE